MRLRHAFAPASVCLAALAAGVWAADWPGFRGNTGGVAPDQDLPGHVTKDNVLWKTKLPGVGKSSPIQLGDKVLGADRREAAGPKGTSVDAREAADLEGALAPSAISAKVGSAKVALAMAARLTRSKKSSS